MDIVQLITTFNPFMLIKWGLFIAIFFYLVFTLIIFNQIRAMDKIITQPLSSAILGLFSMALIISSMILMVFVFRLP